RALESLRGGVMLKTMIDDGRPRKALREGAAGVGIKTHFAPEESGERGGDGFRRARLDEHSAHAFIDRLDRATDARGDRRDSAGGGVEIDEAEALIGARCRGGGEDEKVALAEQLEESRPVHEAGEVDAIVQPEVSGKLA